MAVSEGWRTKAPIEWTEEERSAFEAASAEDKARRQDELSGDRLKLAQRTGHVVLQSRWADGRHITYLWDPVLGDVYPAEVDGWEMRFVKDARPYPEGRLLWRFTDGARGGA